MDEQKRNNSDYEPNFVLKDTPEETAEDSFSSSKNNIDTETAGENTTNNTPDPNELTGENLHENASADTDNSYSSDNQSSDNYSGNYSSNETFYNNFQNKEPGYSDFHNISEDHIDRNHMRTKKRKKAYHVYEKDPRPSYNIMHPGIERFRYRRSFPRQRPS